MSQKEKELNAIINKYFKSRQIERRRYGILGVFMYKIGRPSFPIEIVLIISFYDIVPYKC